MSTASTLDERKYCMLEYAMLYFRQSPFRYVYFTCHVYLLYLSRNDTIG